MGNNNGNDVQIDETIMGYSICAFLVAFGIAFLLLFDGFMFSIGLVLFILGFIFLSVHLNDEAHTKYSLFTLALGFLIVSFFIAKIDFLLVKILFVFFVSFAFAFSVASIVYTYKNSDKKQNLSIIIFNVLDFLVGLISIFQFFQTVIGWAN